MANTQRGPTQSFINLSISNLQPYNVILFTFLWQTTTTTFGGCTGSFDGTSAACPIASATIALVLEAKLVVSTSLWYVPNICIKTKPSYSSDLTWRDVQYLIAYTSNPDLLVGGAFITNGGNLRVSHSFGFGVMDAEAIVTRAKHWINVPGQEVESATPSQTSG